MLIGALAAATVASPAQAQITVTIAPPALRVEARTVQPSPRHVWVAGYWQWNGTAYAWSPGHWDAPAQAGLTWQTATWSQSGGRWVFTPGRWVQAGGTVSVGVGQPTGTVTGTVTQGTNAVGVAVLHPPTPNTVVVQQPVPDATGVITVAPPALRFERRGPPPVAGHQWIAGYWQWNGTAYAWVPGRWEAPQQLGAVWVAPRWQRRGRGWFFVNGEWRGRRGVVVQQQPGSVTVGVQPGQVVVQQPGSVTVGVQPGQVVVQQPAPVGVEVTVDPPALRVETPGAPPVVGHVWIPGFWRWNGARYDWVTGRWDRPHHPGAVWVAPQWQRRGRGWIFIDGRWGAAQERREERREERQERREERQERREERRNH